MSTHIEAKKGDIAEIVLLPGDPMRAKWIAENFLDNPILYNDVRGMYGYTGGYNGHRISVQGTGMGVPSTLIYCHELINDYGAKKTDPSRFGRILPSPCKSERYSHSHGRLINQWNQ
ncbi:MAG: purine-nucleoside phosphorylase [Halioglobus sp.]|jgi:purine-nucleoside phosphorylase